jgi:DNA-directed RNA polymerase subunit B'
MDSKEILQIMVESGMKKGEVSNEANIVDIFYNGRFVGISEQGDNFLRELKTRRRRGELPIELSVRFDKLLNTVFLSTEIGRILRPVVVAENGISRLKKEHIEMIKSGTLNWNDLVKQGVLEYLDAAEEEDCLIAVYEDELTSEHTHHQIDPIDCLGIISSLVPYGNHDQSARLLRGSKTQKQALGIYASNFPVKLDTDVSILHYPQKPIVRSFMYDSINMYPSGQNLVVAVMPYEGYNMEDAVVLNQGSVDRGLGRSTYFRPYSSVELNYAGGLKDEIVIPDKDVPGYKTEESYAHLEDDGIVYLEANLDEKDVIIGKISPPKFLSESREITIQTKKENSTSVKGEEKGIVDGVFVTQDTEGNKIVQVRLRDERKPEPGDKFATPHGQKGVVGFLAPEFDLPFTNKGIRPDLVFNPHGIPSRMTVGYLLEILAGKVAALSGRIIDASCFSSETADSLENQLKTLGFRFDGKEVMYNGITGKKMPVKIYVGNLYYLKLKYMVSNKLHSRAQGKVALLTRQPIEGRSRGGALRLGEMEQEALVSHGASLLLKERYSSDKVTLPICANCGAVVIDDRIKNKKVCSLCNSHQIEYVDISYAFKLLVEEMQSLHLLTKFGLKNKYEQ